VTQPGGTNRCTPNGSVYVFCSPGLALWDRAPFIEGRISGSGGHQSFRVMPLKRFEANVFALQQKTVVFITFKMQQLARAFNGHCDLTIPVKPDGRQSGSQNGYVVTFRIVSDPGVPLQWFSGSPHSRRDQHHGYLS
jgi:hypothetical protein